MRCVEAGRLGLKIPGACPGVLVVLTDCKTTFKVNRAKGFEGGFLKLTLTGSYIRIQGCSRNNPGGLCPQCRQCIRCWWAFSFRKRRSIRKYPP